MKANSLRERLTTLFNRNELKDLCFDLNVDFEEFDDTKSAIARGLIIRCEQQDRVPELIAHLRELRPDTAWPDASRSHLLADLLGESIISVLPYEPETIGIPAGTFLMGSQLDESVSEWESPIHEILLSAFYIGKYPVMNEQYAAFIKHELQQDAPRKAGWKLRQPPDGKLDFPVVGVSWQDAQMYCRWLSTQTGRRYRLPTEAEWEKAAKGSEDRLYPWGNKWEDGRCNVGGSGATAVNLHPEGASPYGCQDMLGNVQEWSSTLWGSDPDQNQFPYPYQEKDGREDIEADQHLHRVYRIHRGGSYRDDASELRCSTRGFSNPNSKLKWRGFRVVLEI